MNLKSTLVMTAAIGFAVLSSGSASAQTTVTIDVFNFDFGNATTGTHIDPVINVGDTVQWVWVNGTHSTTSAGGQAESWDSTVQSPPFSFPHTFTQVGTFNYYCQIHGLDLGNGQVSGMSGHVTVNPVPEPTLILTAAGVFGALAFGRRRNSTPPTAAPTPPASD